MRPGEKTLGFTAQNLSQAAELLKQGGLVAVPTETVYGLAASAEKEAAVENIFAVKKRNPGKPLSILVTGMKMVENYCREIPPVAYELAEKYWPGPLTMVLKDGGVVPSVVTAGGDTLGVRCPDHPLTLELIEKAETPLAAPSANPSDLPSPKRAEEVWAYFDGEIEGIMDGGPCEVGVESTIVDLTGPAPKILREGGIPAQEILAWIKETTER